MSGAPSAAEDPRLALAVSLARRAGRDILSRQETGPVRWKGPGDRVTATDTLVQSWIAREVRTRFPDDGIIAEENMRFAGAREFVWIVDPLDGTNNTCFAVSIGVFRVGEPYADVIHDPNSGFLC